MYNPLDVGSCGLVLPWMSPNSKIIQTPEKDPNLQIPGSKEPIIYVTNNNLYQN